MEKKLKEAFRKLYQSIPVETDEYGVFKPVAEQKYVTFTAMQGYRYFYAKDSSGKPFRFMLIGRAVNGWDEYRAPGTFTKEVFIESSMKNLQNAPEAVVRGSDYKDRFEWIDTSGDSAKNAPRVGIDSNPDTIKDKPYLLTRSPLWSYSKGIWTNLYGEKQPWEKRWFENIVWSNLYKIAPHDGGNPNGKLMKAQESACVNLLSCEIQYFNPTHILFITGKDWFAPFAGLFTNLKLREANCPSGKNKNNVYVEGTAEYLFPNGDVCKAVIACRPELRPKEEYISQVSDFMSGKETIE